jgi:hypothetical protein
MIQQLKITIGILLNNLCEVYPINFGLQEYHPLIITINWEIIFDVSSR